MSEDEYVPLEEENIEPNSVVKEVKDHEIINPDLEEQSDEISRSDFQENSFENASLNILEGNEDLILVYEFQRFQIIIYIQILCN